ncbi:MAG: DUF559 domain-containing protein [Rhizobiaceae bacterium]|nr:DUF559 domain-containing protein [Rhizobiaceae bacterium]
MRGPDRTIRRAKELRADMSLPEVLLWDQLRKLRLAGFRRQPPAGQYVLDFYCACARLAVEVDGAHHFVESGLAQDRIRDDWLGTRGIEVLRIPATDILDRNAFDGALREIEWSARERLRRLAESVEGEGSKTAAPPPALRATSPVNGGGSAVRPAILPCEAGEVARRAGGGEISSGPEQGESPWTPG